MQLKECNGHVDFWGKKQIVFYCMAVLVFFNHTSSFLQYSQQIDNTWIKHLSLLIQQVIPPVSVSLFLMISGALFYRNYTNSKYIDKLKSRVYSLIIPFLLWNTINMLFEIVATCFFSRYFTGRQGFVFSVENIFLGIFNYKYNGPFWFIFALILFSVLAPVINFIISDKRLGIAAIAAVILINSLGIKFPKLFSFDQFAYYLIGAYIGKHNFELIKSRNLSTPSMCLSVFIVIIEWTYKALCEFGVIESNTLIGYILMIPCTFATWRLFDVVYLFSGKREFVNHSFWVFALHVNVGAVVTKLLLIVLPKTAAMSIVNFILTIALTLILIEIICVLMKKLCKPLYDLLSGNR